MNPKYRYRDIDDTRKLDKTVHALNDLKEYKISFATSCHPMAFTRVFEINPFKDTDYVPFQCNDRLYGYRDSHYNNKTVVRTYLYYRNPYADKCAAL